MAMNDGLWIAKDVFERMIELVVEKFPRETGGMLLGYEANNGEAVVTAIIGPGPNAKHSRFRFKPDADFQQQELNRHFFDSAGKETYLGDWHSHPGGSSRLSLLDKRTLHRIAATPTSRTVHPIMLVIGGQLGSWEPTGARFMCCVPRSFFNDYHLRPLTLRQFSRDRMHRGDNIV